MEYRLGPSSSPENPQVIIGIEEEFEIGPHFLEPCVAQIFVVFQTVKILASSGFKVYDGIQSGLTSSHAQNLQQ